MGVNKLFDISRSSLAAYQKALAVTSNNIANANNPNYARQRVVLSTEIPDVRTRVAFGSGVKLEDIVRVKSNITETQIRTYNQSYSFANKQSSILGQVESLLSEPSELGLSNLMSNFFNSWDELSVNPTSVPLRNNVVQTAQQMSTKLENLYSGMNRIKSDLKGESKDLVQKLNGLTEQIRVLNRQVYEGNATGGSSVNDLLDKRDQLVNELSQIANINVSYDEYNVANISIGGVFAVDRIQSTQFTLTEDSGKLKITTEDGAASLTLNGGELFAIAKVYNKQIPDYQKDLDTIANSIYEQVNSLHSSAYSNTQPPSTNIKFFDSYDHGVLKLNSSIVDNVNLIAVSNDGTSGNNSIALQIAKIQDLGIVDGVTISEKYSNFISGLGNEKRVQEQNSQSYELVLNQLEVQKSEYSGVSIDEEMISVLKFQRSYDASAKLIKVADEILQTLLQLV